MSAGVPAEIGCCIFVRGDDNDINADKGAFVIEYREGMESFRYEEIGRDEDGIYLLADTGDLTRITGGEEMFEDTGDLSLARLEIRTEDYDIFAQYEIRRAPDASATYGA